MGCWAWLKIQPSGLAFSVKTPRATPSVFWLQKPVPRAGFSAKPSNPWLKPIFTTGRGSPENLCHSSPRKYQMDPPHDHEYHRSHLLFRHSNGVRATPRLCHQPRKYRGVGQRQTSPNSLQRQTLWGEMFGFPFEFQGDRERFLWFGREAWAAL